MDSRVNFGVRESKVHYFVWNGEKGALPSTTVTLPPKGYEVTDSRYVSNTSIPPSSPSGSQCSKTPTGNYSDDPEYPDTDESSSIDSSYPSEESMYEEADCWRCTDCTWEIFSNDGKIGSCQHGCKAVDLEQPKYKGVYFNASRESTPSPWEAMGKQWRPYDSDHASDDFCQDEMKERVDFAADDRVTVRRPKKRLVRGLKPRVFTGRVVKKSAPKPIVRVKALDWAKGKDVRGIKFHAFEQKRRSLSLDPTDPLIVWSEFLHDLGHAENLYEAGEKTIKTRAARRIAGTRRETRFATASLQHYDSKEPFTNPLVQDDGEVLSTRLPSPEIPITKGFERQFGITPVDEGNEMNGPNVSALSEGIKAGSTNLITTKHTASDARTELTAQSSSARHQSTKSTQRTTIIPKKRTSKDVISLDSSDSDENLLVRQDRKHGRQRKPKAQKGVVAMQCRRHTSSRSLAEESTDSDEPLLNPRCTTCAKTIRVMDEKAAAAGPKTTTPAMPSRSLLSSPVVYPSSSSDSDELLRPSWKKAGCSTRTRTLPVIGSPRHNRVKQSHKEELKRLEEIKKTAFIRQKPKWPHGWPPKV